MFLEGSDIDAKQIQTVETATQLDCASFSYKNNKDVIVDGKWKSGYRSDLRTRLCLKCTENRNWSSCCNSYCDFHSKLLAYTRVGRFHLVVVLKYFATK